MQARRRHALFLGAILGLLAVRAPAGHAGASRLELVAMEREPAGGKVVPDAAAIDALAKAVAAAPGERKARFALVQALRSAGRTDDALTAARAWRAADAYNLVVVRLLGDLYSELGDKARARRAYSAVVELLPKDAGAQRALASVLKQAGDLEGARDRLVAAAALRPDDRRLAFELADVDSRLGRLADARRGFETIADDPSVADAVRYPASQRLAQIDHQLRRAALAAGHRDEAEQLARAIAGLGLKGGSENDIKVYLSWDTDRSDVDLWVTTPSGELVNYKHKTGKGGEALYDDVTTGYGPESFTVEKAQAGTYQVQVNYYGAGRSNFSEARGEVVVVLDEGKASERKQVLPYRLFEVGQTVTVARIEVK